MKSGVHFTCNLHGLENLSPIAMTALKDGFAQLKELLVFFLSFIGHELAFESAFLTAPVLSRADVILKFPPLSSRSTSLPFRPVSRLRRPHFQFVSTWIIPDYAVLTMAVITSFNCPTLRLLGGAWHTARPPSPLVGGEPRYVTAGEPGLPLAKEKCILCRSLRDWSGI